MPNINQLRNTGELIAWTSAYEEINKTLAGSALYLTVVNPIDEQTAHNLGEQPGVIASSYHDTTRSSWQLWQDYKAAKQANQPIIDNPKTEHYSLVKSFEGILVIPHNEVTGVQNA